MPDTLPSYINEPKTSTGAMRDLPVEEVKAMVGARRFERIGSRKDHRNGTFLRRFLTSMGQIDVAVPRSREQGSPVDVLGRYRRRAEEVDEMIAEAYVGGVSQRRMADVTEALMGESVGRSTVSRVAKRLDQAVEELRSQPIEGSHPYLYLDATFLDTRRHGHFPELSVDDEQLLPQLFHVGLADALRLARPELPR